MQNQIRFSLCKRYTCREPLRHFIKADVNRIKYAKLTFSLKCRLSSLFKTSSLKPVIIGHLCKGKYSSELEPLIIFTLMHLDFSWQMFCLWLDRAFDYPHAKEKLSRAWHQLSLFLSVLFLHTISINLFPPSNHCLPLCITSPHASLRYMVFLSQQICSTAPVLPNLRLVPDISYVFALHFRVVSLEMCIKLKAITL